MHRHAIRLTRGSDLIIKLHALHGQWRSIKRNETPIVATEERAVEILKQTAPHLTGWSLRMAKNNTNMPLVQYFPSSGILEMQRAVLNLFREEDMVVVAVHELMGHHVQEQKIKEENPDYFMLDRADMQEGCAMRCGRPNIWSDFYARTRIEWQMFRVLRALEDMGETQYWDVYPHAHRMPREYVRSYVRKFREKHSTTSLRVRTSTVGAATFEFVYSPRCLSLFSPRSFTKKTAFMPTSASTWFAAEEEAARRNDALVKQYGHMKSYALWRPHDIVLEWEG